MNASNASPTGRATKRGLVAIAVVGALVAAGVWSDCRARSEASALRAQLDALKAWQRRHEDRWQETQRHPLPAPALPSAARPTPLGSPESHHGSGLAPEEAASPTRGATTLPGTTPSGSAPLELVVFQLDSSFRSDPIDGRAASGARAGILDTATPLLAGRSTIESVECRSSMCRLTSVQDDMEAYRKFVFDVTHAAVCKDCFWTKTGDTADGRPMLTMYIARDGFQLPRPE